jgi:5-hydroxyisourate hydrolase-like protein (transthyretin family)
VERSTVKLTARLFGQASGHPAANLEVTLFQRRLGGLVWSPVTTAHTDASGLVSLRYRVDRDSELMIDWPGDERWTPLATAPIRVRTYIPGF